MTTLGRDGKPVRHLRLMGSQDIENELYEDALAFYGTDPQRFVDGIVRIAYLRSSSPERVTQALFERYRAETGRDWPTQVGDIKGVTR